MREPRPPRPIPDPTRPPMPDPAPDPAPEPRARRTNFTRLTTHDERSTPYSPASLRADIAADRIPEPALIGFDAIIDSLKAGWSDFRRAPAFGLFFAAFYVLGGLVLTAVAAASGQEWWLMPFIVGFPLLAPFAGVGLYEVSRRLESGEALDWAGVLGVVFAQKDRQVPLMAMAILLMFMFWVFVAHTIFAVFMGIQSLTNITNSPELLLQPRGLTMLALGTVIGAGFAAALFGMTVGGLPLILDREVDLVSAIIASFDAVTANPLVMLAWAVTIAAILFAGIAPLFLGLFVALPVLGHASWHMYRHLLPPEDWD
ncbi:DUF2189 domain-containing protein [Paracoccus sp. MC1854]|uniref:DUF2189 domain-containing protein n=1 Tax=Paracoccus sp. MC1854 TaxID=2760306 RepID=UPI001601F0E9|nr:DUF2189 domain-containing protein [Paracoccus sp. MC1854]MBB1490471.1 DUF2189 domain-containing protein [Paracoccus sp. MC1854]